MWGRIDDVKFQTGMAVCRNFITTPHGPAVNRPGFQYVATVQNSAKRTRLIPFTFSSTQTMVIEIGVGYFRFHTFGGNLLAPTATAWSAAGPYNQGDLVSKGGFTYYAATAIPTNTDPASNNAVPPASSAVSWVQTVAAQSTPPAGYTFVGDTLPLTPVTGSLVYIRKVSTTYTYQRSFGRLGNDYQDSVQIPVETITYVGYTGVANSATPGVYWYKLPSTLYEIPNPYAETDIFDIHYTQSADVLTLVHPSYPPAELRRNSATNWTLVNITFASKLAAPTGVSATATPIPTPGTKTNQTYVATRVSDDGSDESLPSTSATCLNNLFDSGSYNTISTGTTDRCNVYRLSGGLYGYIGQTTTGTVIDNDISPDISHTPPNSQNPFVGAGNYPGAVAYVDQRRAFAGTINQPQNAWLTRSATESNLNSSIPTRDDDAIRFKIASRETNAIRHIVPLRVMLLLSASAEWVVEPASASGVLTPSVAVHPQSYVGANNTQPVVVNNNVVFAAARGGHVRELGYQYQAGGYLTDDISLRAPHLFDGYNIIDMAYQKTPQPVIWMVSNSGNLLGLTYVPEQQIVAWHHHDTALGTFESICVVAEGAEDALYAVVKRTISGSTVRYVERMATRKYADLSHACFVDASVTYDGAPITTISSGISHLEGCTVNILADGAVHRQLVVTGGSVTLDQAASVIQIGLPITSDIQTLPLGFDGVPGAGQGRVKNVNKVWLRVYQSSGMFAGPGLTSLTQAKQRTTEVYGAPPNLVTGEVEIVIYPGWGDGGQVWVRQSDPLPLTLVSMSFEVSVGA
jgi:hypothetical protein